MDKKIHVTKTYLPNTETYKSYIDQIFASGWITNHGSLCVSLEKRLTDYLDADNITLVANGTMALQIALKLLELDGEIITTPFSFVATTSAIVWSGLTPRFVDIDQNTLCLDPLKIEEAITPQTSAILPAHIFGNTCEVEMIDEIAKANGLKVIYDAAHSFGVEKNSECILNFGDISIISFHATKIFHTCEGGALTINDQGLFEKARLMLDFGITGPDSIEEIGINAKMNEFEAAMGLCVLEDIGKIIEERKIVYEYYMSRLPGNLQYQLLNSSCNYNYSYFPVIFPTSEMRSKTQHRLNKKNIFPRRYFYPSLDRLNYLKSPDICPISNDISKRILCLPLYVGMERNDIDSIIDTISQAT